MDTCKDIKHWANKKYFYTCKRCFIPDEKRRKPYKDLSWCHCLCKHNILTCTECWKPVALQKGGTYWYVYRERTLAAKMLGSLGGKSRSERKIAAVRLNGKKGGRPKALHSRLKSKVV